MTRLERTEAAERDLDEILTYSRIRFGEAIAADYFFSFDDAFSLLTRHPRAGRAADEIRLGLRRLSHRQQGIYYRLTDDAVLVMRVLHHAMDAASQFDDG